MTWQPIGGICAALAPALALISIIGAAIAAINERRHPRQGDDQAMYH